MSASWGENVYPLDPGEHELMVSFSSWLLGELGVATRVIEVGRHQVAQVTYRAPFTFLGRGKVVVDH
jgi:hypothetical protein